MKVLDAGVLTVAGVIVGGPDMTLGVRVWAKDWGCLATMDFEAQRFTALELDEVFYDGLNCTGNKILPNSTPNYPLGCYKSPNGTYLRAIHPIGQSPNVWARSKIVKTTGTPLCQPINNLMTAVVPLEVFNPTTTNGPFVIGQE